MTLAVPNRFVFAACEPTACQLDVSRPWRRTDDLLVNDPVATRRPRQMATARGCRDHECRDYRDDDGSPAACDQFGLPVSSLRRRARVRQAEHEYGLAPPRVRGLDRVALTRIKTTPQSGEHGEHHAEPRWQLA